MSPRPKFELIIKGGERVFAIDKPTSFGTAPGSTVRLKSDGQILPTHAVVEPRDGVLVVQATGVTMVNGEPVATAELAVGSVLRIGRLELVVRLAVSRGEVTTQPEAQAEPGRVNPVMQAAPPRQSSANLPPVRPSGAVPAVTAPARPSSVSKPAPPVRASGAVPAVGAPARPSGSIAALGAPATRRSGVSAAPDAGALSALGSPAPPDEDDGSGHTMVRPSGRQNVAAEEDFEASSAEPTVMKPIPTGPPGKLQPGDVIAGRYEIVAHLAEGGMGEVYRATHVELGRVFAIKVMKYELSQDPEFVERFKREAVASSRIGQQNIVDISDFGRTDTGRFYFVMEFLDGPTLAQLIHRERVLYASRAVGILVQIARALAAAHEQGIVHRDLKPENVIILQRAGQKDFVKVVDFGVAKVADPSGTGAQTALGVVVGTPQYMSPEQASGLRVDARSDIYSLGLIAWELIAGRVVFEADSAIGVMMAQMRTPAPELVPGLPDSFVPPQLSAIIMRMLEKERDARPQTMLEVVEVFEQFLFGALKATGPQPAVERASGAFTSQAPAPIPLVVPAEAPAAELPTPSPAAPRSRWPLFAAGGVVLLLLAALGFVLTRPPPPVPVPVKVETPPPPPEPTKVVVEPVKPPPPVVQTVVLKIVTTPDKAEAFDGDVFLGLTPVELRWTQGTLLKLRVAKEGFLEDSRSLSPAADLEVNFELKRKPVAPKPKPKPANDDLGQNPY